MIRAEFTVQQFVEGAATAAETLRQLGIAADQIGAKHAARAAELGVTTRP